MSVLPEMQELQDYLSRVSPARLKAVKWPAVSWCNRARCFALFEGGMTPRDISPKRAGVKRTTLYRYFEDFKLLSARRELMRTELESRHKEPIAGAIPESRFQSQWDEDMAKIEENQRRLAVQEEVERPVNEAKVEPKVAPTKSNDVTESIVRSFFGSRGRA